jgi:hypothetical protein
MKASNVAKRITLIGHIITTTYTQHTHNTITKPNVRNMMQKITGLPHIRDYTKYVGQCQVFRGAKYGIAKMGDNVRKKHGGQCKKKGLM